jgi:hypothetical protein
MTTGKRSGGADSPSGHMVPDDEQELREDIEQTRQRLGETVERLAAKADVKSQARAKAAELAGRVKTVAAASRTKAADRAGSVRGQLTGRIAVVRQQAAAGSKGRGQMKARVAPAWEAAPEPVRRAVAKGASTAKQRRAPLGAALVTLIVCYVAVRRWRKR